MSERDFNLKELEYFLEQAKNTAILKADNMYPEDCKIKQDYIRRKTIEIYSRMVGEPWVG